MSHHQEGQVLLVIVLIMAVALTIGLAVVSRSITSIKIATEQEESARAFSAAEAGIESALSGSEIPSLGGISLSVEQRTTGESADFVFPREVTMGETQTVWLIGHDEDGELDPDDASGRYTGNRIEVYWGNSGTSDSDAKTPALEAMVLYQSGTDFMVKRYTVDPYGGRDNSFDNVIGSAGYDVGGKTLQFYKGLNLPTGGGVVNYALRLKLLYSDDVAHLLAVRGVGDDISAQGQCYQSTASLVDSGVTRVVEQCQFYKAPPGLFDFSLYSENDLIK